MPVNPETTVGKLISLPKTTAAEIDDIGFHERLRTESEAIRRLIDPGLEAAKQRVSG